MLSPGYKNTIEMLIEKGANVNAAEEVWHNTPLHFVAMVDSHSPYHDLKNWTEDDSLSNFQFYFFVQTESFIFWGCD